MTTVTHLGSASHDRVKNWGVICSLMAKKERPSLIEPVIDVFIGTTTWLLTEGGVAESAGGALCVPAGKRGEGTTEGARLSLVLTKQNWAFKSKDTLKTVCPLIMQSMWT